MRNFAFLISAVIYIGAINTALAADNDHAKGYEKSMHLIRQEIEYSDDADINFVRAMLRHHQSAIDMAKIELQYGDDPEIRKLAEDTIKAHEIEIEQMQVWRAMNDPDNETYTFEERD